MVKIYHRLIKNSKMTIAEVPTKWKDAVRTMLIENGVEFEEESAEETTASENTETSESAAEDTITSETTEEPASNPETETTETDAETAEKTDTAE